MAAQQPLAAVGARCDHEAPRLKRRRWTAERRTKRIEDIEQDAFDQAHPAESADSVATWVADAILAGMPVIAIFFGIVIRMYYKEHEPRHFHGEHQAQHGKFDFDGNQVVGNITSKNALGLIRQWAQLNRAALDANWSKIKSGKPLERIPPLE